MGTPDPRGVEARIKWMIDHEPGVRGQCANWAWKSLGGDKGNPPAWGCDDAKEVVKKTTDAGSLFPGKNPPRGAIVLYSGGKHGHMCLSKGNGDIMTTDPDSNWGKTGTWTLQGPISDWNLTYAGWSIRYSGVLLHMAEPGEVRMDELHEGQQDSQSVLRLQDVLNFTSIPSPGNIDLPPTGDWNEQTTVVVNAWQQANGFEKSPGITADQAAILFKDSGHVLVGAPSLPEPEPEPDPAGSYFTDYTGKPDDTLVVSDADGYTPLDVKTKKPPFSGVELHMMYANCSLEWDPSGDDGIIRVKYVRDDGDETAFQDYAVPKGRAIGSPDTFLITAQHFELGEKGKGGRWSIRCDGAIKKMRIGTRYAKIAVIGA